MIRVTFSAASITMHAAPGNEPMDYDGISEQIISYELTALPDLILGSYSYIDRS